MIDTIFYYVKHPYTALVCRIAVGLVLVIAGGMKLFDMPTLAQNIENFRLLPVSWVNVVAIILPPVEVIAGLCLIFGFAINGSLFIATSLFVIFGIAIESAILRGLDIECGCFGTSDADMVGLKALIRDVIFLIATIPVWLTPKQIFAIDTGCCVPVVHQKADEAET